MKRRCSIFAFMFLCGIGFALLFRRDTVMADGLDDLGKVVDGSVLTDASEAEDSYLPRLRNSYLYKGEVSISNAGNYYVGVSGSTQCYGKYDIVGLEIYLERAKGANGSFSSYLNWEFEEYEVSELSKSYKVKVEHGYYYRLRGYHYCKENGTYENGATMTDGIYI